MLDDDLIENDNSGREDYYDEDFYEQEVKETKKQKQMTLAEEKEALKKKIKEDMTKKKVAKYKKQAKDILNDPKNPTLDSAEDREARLQRKKTGKY